MINLIVRGIANFNLQRNPACRCLIEALDAALLEAEYSGIAALFLKIGLQFIPGAKVLPTVGTQDPGLGSRIMRYSQPDGKAIRALQPVIEKFLRHRTALLAIRPRVSTLREDPLDWGSWNGKVGQHLNRSLRLMQLTPARPCLAILFSAVAFSISVCRWISGR
ncbi:hypothetical protein [Mesorhizobium sp. B2-4-15]|uniref:hypothetical protein n=1 Tax=Mesorhizobium sp. B2-4-15 TaxID=2589934 RepID=UPI0015EE5134|nr:hypothetical protein [Mesorhizobium sp. B2-4-15]